MLPRVDLPELLLEMHERTGFADAFTHVAEGGHRRRILVQLNRHEALHKLARKVFHGQKGEIRNRYREGQLGALGLVVNAICLFNGLYLDEAVRTLRAGSGEVRDEDLAHVNVLSRYAFELDESVAAGGLRPLRDPDETVDEYEFPAVPLGEPMP